MTSWNWNVNPVIGGFQRERERERERERDREKDSERERARERERDRLYQHLKKDFFAGFRPPLRSHNPPLQMMQKIPLAAAKFRNPL